jgi:molybdenum cofactor guanylyltransferase
MIATNVTTANLTGLVLAGGRGTRMGGVDKGLQLLHGEPLAAHVLKRLAAQTGPLLISANRHAEVYAGLGAPFGAAVVADTLAGFPGPLAGLLAGLRAAGTEFVLSAPCDSPGLPADLAARLALAFDSDEVDIATVTTTDASLRCCARVSPTTWQPFWRRVSARCARGTRATGRLKSPFPMSARFTISTLCKNSPTSSVTETSRRSPQSSCSGRTAATGFESGRRVGQPHPVATLLNT